MTQRRKLNNDNGLQDWKTEHQAVTGGIFYCRVSGYLSVSASNKLSCNLTGQASKSATKTYRQTVVIKIMKLWKYILNFVRKKKEDSFWKHPDIYLAAIILNDEREQVYGIIKNDLARLDRIPKPETGYFYKDIVKVKGPTGKQMFRDDEIDEYQAIELYKASNIPTFTFKALIPNSRDYFWFLEWFKEHEQKVEFPWSSKDNNNEWRKGYCTAEDIEQAKKILNSFFNKKEGRQVKDINPWDYYMKIKK